MQWNRNLESKNCVSTFEQFDHCSNIQIILLLTIRTINEYFWLDAPNRNNTLKVLALRDSMVFP